VKGRGTEPEAQRGDTHPAAPRSRWASPRSRFAGGHRLPDGWFYLLALILIKNIKQRYCTPGAWVSASCLGEPQGSWGHRVPPPSGHQAPQKRPRRGQNAAGGARRQWSSPAQPAPELLPVARGRADARGATLRGSLSMPRVPWQPPAPG